MRASKQHYALAISAWATLFAACGQTPPAGGGDTSLPLCSDPHRKADSPCVEPDGGTSDGGQTADAGEPDAGTPTNPRMEFYQKVVPGSYYWVEHPQEEVAVSFRQHQDWCPGDQPLIGNLDPTWSCFNPATGAFTNPNFPSHGQVFACNCDALSADLQEECRAIGDQQDVYCVNGVKIQIFYDNPDDHGNYYKK